MKRLRIRVYSTNAGDELQALGLLGKLTLFLKKADCRMSPLHWFSSIPALPDLAVLFSNKLPVQTILEHLL